MTKRFHIGFKTQDLQASVAFFSQLFKAQPSKLFDDYAKFDLQDPPLNFTLNLVSTPFENPVSHYGIELTNQTQLDEAQAHLASFQQREEKAEDCCYAKQNKFWVKDPNGIEVEHFLVLESYNQKPEKLEEEACCAPTCCQ